MNKKYFSLLFILTNLFVFAQDGIITKDGDTIRCKILKDDDSYIVFKHSKNNAEKVTLIPKSKVFVYKKNEVREELFPVVVDKFRIGIYTGISFPSHQYVKLFRKDSSDLVFKNNGYNFGADLTYFIKPKTGVGIVVNRAFSHIDYFSPITNYINREQMTYTYLGPMLSKRFANSTHNTYVTADASIGWFQVGSTGSLNDIKYTFSANDLAAMARLGADFRLGRKLYLSLQGTAMYSIIKRYKFSSSQYKLPQSSDLLYTKKDKFVIPSLIIGLRYHF